MKMPEAPQPLTLSAFPRAVLHLDGDAFFTSVEQAIHPELKGRPVVTGKERGIIACASYEAKALGIKRGLALWEAQKQCRELVVLPSDYEVYSIFSQRMFEIMRRYTPLVEEHSIDEGFADIGGLRRAHRSSYQDIARKMQADIQGELDIGVSVGLSLSKGLAKLASKFRKPRGFTPVAGHHLHLFLPRIALADVWGFGRNTVQLLQQHGLRTAWDYVQRPEAWASRLLGKVGRDIWHELRGEAVMPVDPAAKTSYASISKCKTFTAPSADPDFIYAKLIRNVENAFIKLRRHQLAARTVVVGLREKEFMQDAVEARLTRPTSATHEVLPLVRQLFDAIHRPGVSYRSTMVVLGKLQEDRAVQFELFEDPVRIDAMLRTAHVIDEVNQQFGKHKVHLGTALHLQGAAAVPRAQGTWRQHALLDGETARKRLNIPRLAITV
jgi:DNA polymerase IV